MQFGKSLSSFALEFDGIMREFLAERGKRFALLGHDYLVIFEAIEDFLMRGGKRLRPAFVYYGYLGMGGKDRDKIMKASLSVELLHAFLLIHDDIIDRSDLRRGKPTVHRWMEEKATSLGITTDREHFGVSVALIAGDLLQSSAYAALLESGFSSELLGRARKMFDELILETAYGWFGEMLATKGNGKVTKEVVMRNMEYVSARYTVSGPLLLGGVLAGVGERQMEVYREAGNKVGLAFQIGDDLIGMFGDEREVGKSVDSDLHEGKKTILYVKLVSKLKGVDLNRLGKIWGNSLATKDDFEWVKEKLVETGTVKEAKEEMRLLAESAVKMVKQSTLVDETKVFLVSGAEYMLSRQS